MPPTGGHPRGVPSLRASEAVVWTLVLVCLAFTPATGQEGERTDSPAGWSALLSRPLPGTLERQDADLAISLERGLAGFEGIDSARVVIVGPPSNKPFAKPSSRRAAVQVALRPDVPCTRSWTEGVAAFVLQAVPDLDPQELTVVDSGGQVLYASGQGRQPERTRLAAQPEPQKPAPRNAWPWLLLGLLMGCAVTGCVLLGTRGRRLLRAPTPPGGPLGFLESLSDAELRVSFAGERAPVVAAALGQLPARAQQRLRRTLAVPAEVKSPATAPPSEVLDAMARALRAKLEDRQEFGT